MIGPGSDSTGRRGVLHGDDGWVGRCPGVACRIGRGARERGRTDRVGRRLAGRGQRADVHVVHRRAEERLARPGRRRGLERLVSRCRDHWRRRVERRRRLGHVDGRGRVAADRLVCVAGRNGDGIVARRCIAGDGERHTLRRPTTREGQRRGGGGNRARRADGDNDRCTGLCAAHLVAAGLLDPPRDHDAAAGVRSDVAGPIDLDVVCRSDCRRAQRHDRHGDDQRRRRSWFSRGGDDEVADGRDGEHVDADESEHAAPLVEKHSVRLR